jgi:hypothetical protein
MSTLSTAGHGIRRLRAASRTVALSSRRIAGAARTLVHGLVRRLRSARTGGVRSGPPGAAVLADHPGAARRHRVARRMSVATAVLMATASAAGLAWRTLYQDPAPLVAVLRGYDLVALLVAVPLLAAALARARRGSQRALLVWGGVLGYAFYHYAIYALGTSFNALFLLHAALFALSGLALVVLLRSLDVAALAARFQQRTPARTVSGLLAALAVALGGMWTYYSVRFALTGATPGENRLVLPLAGVHLGYVLDLVLLVPSYAAAAVLLRRRRPWGFTAASVLLVAGALSQLDYTAALLVQAVSGVPGATAFDPVEPVILGVYAAGAAALLEGLARRGAAAGAETEAEEVLR